MVPAEAGLLFWQRTGALRIYVAPSIIVSAVKLKGLATGAEFVFTPKFAERNLSLILALGVTLDKSS